MLRFTLALLPLLCIAESSYQKPPAAIEKVLASPATPTANVSPTRDAMLLLEADRYPSIKELAQPMLRLAGHRINPLNNGRSRAIVYRSYQLVDLQTLTGRKVSTPTGATLGIPRWSPTGKYFAFEVNFDTHIELWVGETRTGIAKKVDGVQLNSAYGEPVQWMPQGKGVLVQMVAAGRGAAPRKAAVPAGPLVQESAGRGAPAPTYQDLLASEYDEALFEYYGTSQLALVDLETRKVTPIGKTAIVQSSEISPDGLHLMVSSIHKPFSWMHPAELFPREMEVWSMKGQLIRVVASQAMADRVPIEGVRTGPRNAVWHPLEPSMLVWVEALDGGNPKEKAQFRDKLVTLRPPFQTPRDLHSIEQRVMGTLQFTAAGDVIVRDFERNRKWLRTFLVGKQTAKLMEERNLQDRYKNPGIATMDTLDNGQKVLFQDGEFAYYIGEGASPRGDLPFVDRVSIATGNKRRIFQSSATAYELPVAVLSRDGSRLLIRHESPSEPPNYYLLDKDERKEITHFTDPAPELRKVTKKLVTYKRADGVPLSFTLYLPPNYKEGTPLPAVMWSYPREFNDADTAGQISGSPNRFTTITGTSHLFFLLEGYAILDDATLPVVGTPETVNNTYIEQIVAGAKAAIEKGVELGVVDAARVGVGGHSYGAFMTANLLAHSDLFRAGIARSGAYNRTLTPFGFQSERRTLWEAPETYLKMSPFLSANKINKPILLIHGEADNNTGTFPIQSERMYAALRGNGATVRYVQLPFESHGYTARESTEHTLWEMVSWFNKHVKDASAR